MTRIIIGLTGAFGSGTSFIANYFLMPKGFKKLSLSTALKELFQEHFHRDAKKRSELQEFGNKIRKENIVKLAEIINEEIQKEPDSNFVIDSIRNPAEVQFFRSLYPEFILIGIFAEYEVRWNRVKANYHDSKDSFDIDEQKDQGKLEPNYGQRISDCFFESDLILSNNENISIDSANEKYEEMNSKIEGYLKALKDPAHSNPTIKETLMAAAYTSGRRSKCIKRKVGAVITDKLDRIISSGFNGVPYKLKECRPILGHCYRDEKRAEIAISIANDLKHKNIEQAKEIIQKRVKLLELCRAMHGEESAIINLVGLGVDLTDSTIYVTTYPCNLCANKIVQIGIKKVIYYEPYPVDEAKKIFEDGNVISEPFEGVTFRAFFKFYQYEP